MYKKFTLFIFMFMHAHAHACLCLCSCSRPRQRPSPGPYGPYPFSFPWLCLCPCPWAMPMCYTVHHRCQYFSHGLTKGCCHLYLGLDLFLCLINSIHVYRRYITEERDRMRGWLSQAAIAAQNSMTIAFADLKYVHNL
jgi:hypothetical protein